MEGKKKNNLNEWIPIHNKPLLEKEELQEDNNHYFIKNTINFILSLGILIILSEYILYNIYIHGMFKTEDSKQLSLSQHFSESILLLLTGFIIPFVVVYFTQIFLNDKSEMKFLLNFLPIILSPIIGVFIISILMFIIDKYPFDFWTFLTLAITFLYYSIFGIMVSLYLFLLYFFRFKKKIK